MSDKKARESRFLIKIKQMEGQNGKFLKAIVNNNQPKTKTGEANKYYQGSLVFFDAKTGKRFNVKSLSVLNASESEKERGFVSSLVIDLNDSYCVDEIKA